MAATTSGVTEVESAEAHPTSAAPQPSPAAVLRVAPVDEGHAHADGGGKHVQPLVPAHGQSMAPPRIHARVPPPEPPRMTVAPMHASNGLDAGSAGGTPPAYHAVRDNQFRVRTALTKGWRKGKKSRKSVGGGRGPGFTAREVDGLLELLEEAVPVTREEWEAVRNKHALRFPGTSRSIDSIRRKFAKVYLARGQAGAVDGNPPLVVRRAKNVRERMAARAVSLEEQEAAEAMEGVPTVEAMDGGELPDEDDVLDASPHAHPHQHQHQHQHQHAHEDAHPHPDAAVVTQTVNVNLEQPVLDEGNIAVLQPVVSEPMTMGGVPDPSPMEITGGAAPPPPSHPHPHVHAHGDKLSFDDMASIFKGFMEQQQLMFKDFMDQQAQWREEDLRQQEAWRDEVRAMEKARDERSEKLIQQLLALQDTKRTS